MNKLTFIFLALLPAYVFPIAINSKAWWTGSLLTSSGRVHSVGSVGVEPYLFVNQFYGIYDKDWKLHEMRPTLSVNPALYLATGIAKNLEIAFYGQGFYNKRGSKSFTGVGDTSVGLHYQFMDEDENIPSSVLAVIERFPTGNYHHLNPDFETSDGVGAGSYRTSLGLAMQKEYEIKKDKWIRWRLNISYTMGFPVHIQGFSVYGGGFGTDGTINPGNNLYSIISLEYEITKEWVISIDGAYSHTNKSTFRGMKGVTKTGDVAPVGRPSSEQISAAPAIEYNFNENIGIIAGVWFTCFGRNAAAFYTPSIAVNMFF